MSDLCFIYFQRSAPMKELQTVPFGINRGEGESDEAWLSRIGAVTKEMLSVLDATPARDIALPESWEEKE